MGAPDDPPAARTRSFPAHGPWRVAKEGRAVVMLSFVYVLDFAVFVLVFLIIRSQRANTRLITAVVTVAAVMYLTSLVFLIFISRQL